MSDSKNDRHPQTGLPMSDKPPQQRVVEQATEAGREALDQQTEQHAEREDEQDGDQTRNAAGYDEALAGREMDGGESLLSGLPRESDSDAAAEVDVPDDNPTSPKPGD